MPADGPCRGLISAPLLLNVSGMILTFSLAFSSPILTFARQPGPPTQSSADSGGTKEDTSSGSVHGMRIYTKGVYPVFLLRQKS